MSEVKKGPYRPLPPSPRLEGVMEQLLGWVEQAMSPVRWPVYQEPDGTVSVHAARTDTYASLDALKADLYTGWQFVSALRWYATFGLGSVLGRSYLVCHGDEEAVRAALVRSKLPWCSLLNEARAKEILAKYSLTRLPLDLEAPTPHNSGPCPQRG